MIGAMGNRQKKNFGIRGLDGSRSYINNVKAFPLNVNIKHVLTYNGSKLPSNNVTGTMSVEMTQSFIELPAEPMQPRLFDERVSYFSLSQTDYSSDAQRADRKRYITRWRLEPIDQAAYDRGELVEPKKQIVYYIDPATPKKWIPFLEQGVNDWKIAFEKAGFKNAITAKMAPTKEEDPDWSPEDVRYSVIRYVSTDIQNAMGPHVHDPRSGEILESDIIWYHNVMNLLRNWFFVQTAAINPEARSPQFKDDARFNYVAQPGDGDVGLMPGVGPYDKWSIDFGYRRHPGADSPEDFSQLRELYGNVFGQFRRYVGHVSTNVGGVYEFYKSSDEGSEIYTHVEKAKQKDAIKFLNENVFETPTWLIDKEVLNRIEETGIVERIRGLQDRTLATLFNQDRLYRMQENAAVNNSQSYSIKEMMNDLVAGIYKETQSGQSPSIYRRNLQRTFIEGLERVLGSEANKYEHSDAKAIARGTLKKIKQMLQSANASDELTKYHYADLQDRVTWVFENEGKIMNAKSSLTGEELETEQWKGCFQEMEK